MKIFVVQHSFEVEPCGHDETKFIGVYLTKLEAESAIKRLSSQPGFNNKPDCFHISEYEAGKDYWTEGFETIQ